jgi:sugar phosphate permease
MSFPTRYGVVAMAVMLAGITYLDRVAIGVVAPEITKELGLTKSQMGWVFSAFTIAYATFEIPTAAWADRIGARGVIARIVCWWSAFTMATAGAFNYISLLVIRFLFGVGEAGAWPCVGRVFSRWIPAPERGRVWGIFFAGAFLAGGLTPKLVVELSNRMQWRYVFLVFGVIGFVWAAAWYWWFRDEPREKAGIDPEEVKAIEATRGLSDAKHDHNWSAVFKIPSTWPICIAHAANSYGTYFVMTWLPTYLTEARGLSKDQMTVFAGLPMIVASIGAIGGGWVTDLVTRRMGLAWGRAGVAAGSYVVAAIAMAGAAWSQDGIISGICIAAAYGMSMFTLGAAFSTCIELGKENSGVMTATMNTAGQIGGTLSPLVLAKLVETYGDWSLPLYVIAAFYAAAVFSWLLIGRHLGDTRLDGKH